MAQRINVVLNSIPSESRDLVEFIFFCAVGFTAGNLGLLWDIFFINNFYILNYVKLIEVPNRHEGFMNKKYDFIFFAFLSKILNKFTELDEILISKQINI